MVNLTIYTLNPKGQKEPVLEEKKLHFFEVMPHLKYLGLLETLSENNSFIMELRVPTTGILSHREYTQLNSFLTEALSSLSLKFPLYIQPCDPKQIITIYSSGASEHITRNFQGKFYAYYFDSNNVKTTLINTNRWDTILGLFQEYGLSFHEPIHISIRGAKRLKISLEEIKSALKETTNTEIIIEC